MGELSNIAFTGIKSVSLSNVTTIRLTSGGPVAFSTSDATPTLEENSILQNGGYAWWDGAATTLYFYSPKPSIISIESPSIDEVDLESRVGVLETTVSNMLTPDITTYAAVQQTTRRGEISQYIALGDQLEVNKASAVTAAIVATGITNATVTFQTFLNKIGTIPAGIYQFVFADGVWKYNSNAVVLSQYGIVATGTPNAGDIINITVAGETLEFDVVATDGYDHPVNAEQTHALSLMLHGVYAMASFDSIEAMYYATAELPAGTYNFTLPAGYDEANGGGKTYQFVLASPVPLDGQIAFPWGAVQALTVKIATYATKTATSAIESNISVIEGAAGTSLGTLPTGAATANLNNVQQMRFGSNIYRQSAMRQWLNSNAASGWWTPSTNFDRPYSTPTAGFLYGVDPDFINVIGAVKKRTAKNTISDGGGYEDTSEVVFLPSVFEIFGAMENNVKEGGVDSGGIVETTAYPYYVGSTAADRIKYLTGAARTWWLRSPYSTYAGGERFVNIDGSLYYYGANFAYGAVPACCII